MLNLFENLIVDVEFPEIRRTIPIKKNGSVFVYIVFHSHLLLYYLFVSLSRTRSLLLPISLNMQR